MEDQWIAQTSELLVEQLRVGEELMSLFGASASANSSDLTSEALAIRWLDATEIVLRDRLGVHEQRRFRDCAKKYVDGDYRSLHSRVRNAVKFVAGTISVVEDFPGQLVYTEPALSKREQFHLGLSSAASKPSASTNGPVFLIHGHDELNLLRLERYLRDSLGLKPMTMSAEPAEGLTLIEKFEKCASQCVFAFALLTPDDTVKTGDGEYAQARPNVVFELGWFYSALGRNRVCLLAKDGLVIHSDLSGINRIDFHDSVNEVFEDIRREIKASGVGVGGEP